MNIDLGDTAVNDDVNRSDRKKEMQKSLQRR